MALLFPPEILPNVARVLFRTLQAADGFRLSKDELARSVAPAALPRGEGAPRGPGTRGFDNTLTACLAVGLFDHDGGAITLHPALPDVVRDRRRGDQYFQSVVRDLVLREAVNDGLWDSSEGARDLTRALAWFLAQNPLRPPSRWNEPDGADVMEDRQFATHDRVFSNDTRWGAFSRWAPFLGFARHIAREGKEVLVPDPTEVVRDLAPSVFATQRQEIGDVLEGLRRHLPVLDGGTYRREVELRMRPEHVKSADDVLSPSLAHALLRLRDEKVIVLEDLADAPLKIRLPEHFGPEHTITHASLSTDRRRKNR